VVSYRGVIIKNTGDGFLAVIRLAILALTQFWCSSDYSAPISLA
jgi:hypothetical protein